MNENDLIKPNKKVALRGNSALNFFLILSSLFLTLQRDETVMSD